MGNQAMTLRGRHGFTFLEIMFVVVIIGILLGVAVTRYTDKANKARISTTKLQLGNIHAALAQFEMHVGRFPDTREGLQAILTRPGNVPEQLWEGPYLTLKGDNELLVDAWHNPLGYRSPGEKNRDYDLWSLGPDGREGTGDDIVH